MVSLRTAGHLFTVTFVLVIHSASLGYWCIAAAPSVPGVLFLKEEGGISPRWWDLRETPPPPPQASCPLNTCCINTKLRVKRLKIRWLNQCSRLSSYFCYLNASLPLRVYALGYVKLWFRAWSFLLIPFTKFWAVHFADYSSNSETLPGHIPAPVFFFFVFLKYCK